LISNHIFGNPTNQDLLDFGPAAEVQEIELGGWLVGDGPRGEKVLGEEVVQELP
jgi:hypothetical protein